MKKIKLLISLRAYVSRLKSNLIHFLTHNRANRVYLLSTESEAILLETCEDARSNGNLTNNKLVLTESSEQNMQRSNLINVRKLLKFRNGILNPTCKDELEALRQGNLEYEAYEKVKNANSQMQYLQLDPKDQPTRKNVSKDVKGLYGGTKNGHSLHSKLASKSAQRGIRSNNFNSLLQQLVLPLQNEDDLNRQSCTFLQEDVFSSAKFRATPHEADIMQVRYDGPLVLARSICGSRNSFNAQMREKIMFQDQNQCFRKYAKRQSASTVPLGARINTKKELGLVDCTKSNDNFKKGENRMSQQQCKQNYDEKHKAKLNIIEQEESDKSKSRSIRSLSENDEDESKISLKKLRASKKLGYYKKGWQRMSKIFNQSAFGSAGRVSLLDQQINYVSPRMDGLSSFYESAQQNASVCKNDLQRAQLIEDTFRQEGIKFDHEFARKSWVGGLRDDKFMFLQTTRNPVNELHCIVSTNSQDYFPHSTKSSHDYRCRMGDDVDQSQRPGGNQSGQQDTMLPTEPTSNLDMAIIEKTSNNESSVLNTPRFVRQGTTIIDGTILDMMRQNKQQGKTYRSKQQNRNREVYLPFVAARAQQIRSQHY